MMKMKSVIAGLVLAMLSVAPGFSQGVGQLGSGQLWANPTATQARAKPTSLSAYLDFALGSTAAGFPARISGSWVEAAFGSSFAFSGSTLNLNPSGASVLGGVNSLSCPSHQWFNSLSTAGVFNCAQPALADLPTGTQDTVLGYWASTVVTATAMPNCTGALTYSTSSHTFGCNTTAGTGTVTSVTASGGATTDTGSAITATGNISVQQMLPGGRLTLTSGTPVTTTDVTNATTIYYAPLNSEYVPIYNGTVQKMYPFTASAGDTVGLSAVLGSNWASGSAYDWFVGLNGSTVTLCSGPAWSSAAAGSSTRGTGAGTTQLALFNGVWTNAVSLTCRFNNTTTFTCAANQCTYVGSTLMTASGAATDSAAQRYLFNLYNQSQRYLANPAETTASWSYTTATWRQARASTSNQFSVFVGLPGTLIDLRVDAWADTSAGTSFAAVGIGVNSTGTDSSISKQGTSCLTHCYLTAQLKSYAVLGLSNYVWLEASAPATGTTNFYGQGVNGGIVYLQSGILGTMLN